MKLWSYSQAYGPRQMLCPADVLCPALSSVLYLDLLQDISLHLHSHVVHIMVRAVVHHCILKHQHNIPLELGCGSDQPVLNVLFDGRQIHWPVKEMQVKLQQKCLTLSHLIWKQPWVCNVFSYSVYFI